MYWRNRLKFDHPQMGEGSSPSHSIEESAVFNFSPSGNVFIADDILPDAFVIQVFVKPTFKANKNTFIKADPSATPVCVYDGDALPFKAIEKMALFFEGFIFDGEKNTDWQKKINIPACIYEISFDTLKDGTHVFDKEKRLPQENSPRQSLWSYGATYSMDFDLCQVSETKILPMCVNNATVLRYTRAPSPHTLGDKIFSGCICLDAQTGDTYQSYFIKNISPIRAHLYMKKISNGL
ncbi:MAG: hypothetical protein CNLJKLNK_01150 [Holosporales bacterium]